MLNLDSEYWDITLSEYSVDAEAILSYVLKISHSSTIGVVCYSISCTSIYQLMIENDKYNHLIKPLFNLAPFIYYNHSISVPLRLISLLEPYLK